MIFPFRCSVCPGPPIVSHRVSFMLIFLSSHLDSRIFCAQLCPRAYLRPRASLIGHGPAQFRPRASITSATGQHNFGHGPEYLRPRASAKWHRHGAICLGQVKHLLNTLIVSITRGNPIQIAQGWCVEKIQKSIMMTSMMNRLRNAE